MLISCLSTFDTRNLSSNEHALASPNDALEILRSQPDCETLSRVLQYLDPRKGLHDDFDIGLLSPRSAQLINALVNNIVPDYWTSPQDERFKQDRLTLLDCLRGVSGIGCVLVRVKLLTSQASTRGESSTSFPVLSQIRDCLDILDHVLKGHDYIFQVRQLSNRQSISQTQRSLVWKELIAQLATGKVPSVAAQAEDALKLSDHNVSGIWLANGSEYATWLGQNIAALARNAGQEASEDHKAAAQLCGKALSMGFTDQVVGAILDDLTLREGCNITHTQALVHNMLSHEQRHFLEATLRLIGKRYIRGRADQHNAATVLSPSTELSACTALLTWLIEGNSGLKEKLVAWLTAPTTGVSDSVEVRRAAVAALATEAPMSPPEPSSVTSPDDGTERLQQVLESSMQQFGDQLSIKHTPIMQQEMMAQTLLISAGYVHRLQPMFLFTLARSSTFLNAISNRLASTSPRARFLGMIVGTTISELIDKPDVRMKFNTQEMETPEAEWYRMLARLNDGFTKDEDLTTLLPNKGRTETSSKSKPLFSVDLPKRQSKKASLRSPTTSNQLSGPRIVEVTDDPEEDDLVPYGKLDSDPEDEDEDSTLVQRNKPTAPVYIRDLIASLRDTENYDRHSLALTSASSLIRRKTGFGKEVSNHAEELAAILVGLGDPFDIDNFEELRLQALIALILSDPQKMAPWFARIFFEGDFSINQRTTILSALGLSARELAGFSNDELNPQSTATSSSSNPSLTTPFPSKTLPPHLHALYAPPSNTSALTRTARTLSNTLMAPLAARAADSLTGPTALKTRSFSSRLAVAARRKPARANALAPLAGPAFRAGVAHAPTQQPQLLAHLLTTLAIVLHAAGPTAPALPQMTRELWDVLFAARGPASMEAEEGVGNERAVLSALLFGALTLLEVNEAADARALVLDFGREVVETGQWAGAVVEKFSGGGAVGLRGMGHRQGERSGREEGGEDERIAMLAAAVLLRTREIVEKHQRLLVGETAGL
ncbi:hypothetical protein LTR04_000991 [Oleoguttula sp. CCFEE 6159]|nr:hypothetical protein LTR04_000991 [Oleoguttula sp. CCFEE 6159]